jgi:hypothetical protein
VFSVSTFRELPTLEQKLLTPITTLTAEQIQQILASTRYPPPGRLLGLGCFCCSFDIKTTDSKVMVHTVS